MTKASIEPEAVVLIEHISNLLANNVFEKIIKSLPDNAKASFVVHGGVIMAILEAFCEHKVNFYDYHIKKGEFLIFSFENGKIKI